MKKLFVFLLIALLSGTAAFAQDAPPPGNGNTHYGWADVLRVDPVYRTVQVNQPQQQCYDQPVVREERHSSAAGTLLGAVVGGVLGNTIGKGDGRKAATVAGAVAGGAIGNRVSGGGTRTYEGTETRCQNINSVSEERRVIGYNVEYRYRGDVYVSRLDYDPGDRLRIRISVSPVD
ncbi:glycine zipper 2TM domain-containing protein [Oleiagrimonas soli]|uniref:Membrane protein n=1 Tax=Oleiagrimonas soli TaxID=1543381 RepID=A0A099CYE1_9GAMM|nr:glycine zipper 2TM domain-containing protein [Oleiagrimonas soli]KGI78010.1 membrane protein [Oleiagrimonas soli]MBB6183599.1 uncharacterized protein YcfJ [Oleiagrimonas soli]